MVDRMADIERYGPRTRAALEAKVTELRAEGWDVIARVERDKALLERDEARDQLEGAVEALRDLANEAAKAVCEPARFDQHDLGLAVARARAIVGGRQA